MKRKEIFQNSGPCSVSLGFEMLKSNWFNMKSDFALLGLKSFALCGLRSKLPFPSAAKVKSPPFDYGKELRIKE